MLCTSCGTTLTRHSASGLASTTCAHCDQDDQVSSSAEIGSAPGWRGLASHPESGSARVVEVRAEPRRAIHTGGDPDQEAEADLERLAARSGVMPLGHSIRRLMPLFQQIESLSEPTAATDRRELRLRCARWILLCDLYTSELRSQDTPEEKRRLLFNAWYEEHGGELASRAGPNVIGPSKTRMEAVPTPTSRSNEGAGSEQDEQGRDGEARMGGDPGVQAVFNWAHRRRATMLAASACMAVMAAVCHLGLSTWGGPTRFLFHSKRWPHRPIIGDLYPGEDISRFVAVVGGCIIPIALILAAVLLTWVALRRKCVGAQSRP